jgi:hypothetical protein
MSLTVDPLAIDLVEWDPEIPRLDDCLRVLWGIQPGVSSPTSARGPVHPSCLASAEWLRALWGYSL